MDFHAFIFLQSSITYITALFLVIGSFVSMCYLSSEPEPLLVKASSTSVLSTMIIYNIIAVAE